MTRLFDTEVATVITKYQQKVLNQLGSFIEKQQNQPNPTHRLELINTQDKRDNAFVQELADELHLHTTWDEVDDYGQSLIVCTFNMEGVSQDGSADGNEEDEDWESDGMEDEGKLAVQRVFRNWSKAAVVDTYPEDVERSMDEKLKEAMDGIKRQYYRVCIAVVLILTAITNSSPRINLRSITTTQLKCRTLYTTMSKDFNGSSTITTRVFPVGAGFTNITTLPVSLVNICGCLMLFACC